MTDRTAGSSRFIARSRDRKSSALSARARDPNALLVVDCTAEQTTVHAHSFLCFPRVVLLGNAWRAAAGNCLSRTLRSDCS